MGLKVGGRPEDSGAVHFRRGCLQPLAGSFACFILWMCFQDASQR